MDERSPALVKKRAYEKPRLTRLEHIAHVTKKSGGRYDNPTPHPKWTTRS